ncbi:unnamed protein product [Polarella glacialis]|uniref:Sel1 repeat family protein n=1 Tax=Polarella glacialis TaxID=89957 RepID=A0A813I1Q1_POLGL|nr:unnamed protein product [Polarella glacialis]CAE8741226.1 unnamed protein product [Polarella glacialis]
MALPAVHRRRVLRLATPLLIGAVLTAGFGEAFRGLSLRAPRCWLLAAGTSKAPWMPNQARASTRVLLAASPADQFREGVACVQNPGASAEQLAQGVSLIHEAADGGDNEAQMALGVFYASGLFGIPVDMNAAIKWLTSAAEAGNIDANYNLGVVLLLGQNGAPQDKREAARRFKIAGEGGHVEAMTNLSKMFINGDGIPRDMPMGAQWLVKAAQKGDKLEELMGKIASGNLDPATSSQLAEMIEKLRDVQQANPYMQPKSGNVVNY